jgi:hypothetical protein
LNVEVKAVRIVVLSMMGMVIFGCTASPTAETSRQNATESTMHKPDPGRDAMTSFLPIDRR